jgi:hypothetical protein
MIFEGMRGVKTVRDQSHWNKREFRLVHTIRRVTTICSICFVYSDNNTQIARVSNVRVFKDCQSTRVRWIDIIDVPVRGKTSFDFICNHFSSLWHVDPQTLMCVHVWIDVAYVLIRVGKYYFCFKCNHLSSLSHMDPQRLRVSLFQ